MINLTCHSCESAKVIYFSKEGFIQSWFKCENCGCEFVFDQAGWIEV